MSIKLLLTSFQTWLPHQVSNSSDDLLEIIESKHDLFDGLFVLRKLPVNTQIASDRVIETIKVIQPQGIICCGMAESRELLTIESQAICGDSCMVTPVNLNSILDKLFYTKISHDAGKFVCEGLYYQILNYLENQNLNIPCIFVHVPLLNYHNREKIEQDFITIISCMQSNCVDLIATKNPQKIEPI
ncbi:peptidase C15 pyroglutamyl peptidase I [Chondrocystis sp. NIES-4102]|nr:peptidase C15 pyroglutamyl peptidase I [Chondrocystis sp. NIES-4102]